jgi:hypothetical protein
MMPRLGSFKQNGTPGIDPLPPVRSANLPQAPQWHTTFPLAFALLPALGSLLLPSGSSALITDTLLLALSSIFLHQLLTIPWDLYYTCCSPAPTRFSHKPPPAPSSSASTPSTPRLNYSPTGADGNDNHDNDKVDADEQATASRELNYIKYFALGACFVGPLLGGFVLHLLRKPLSRSPEGLVSTFNLTIFVLAAELRPCAEAIRLLRGRAVHLQRAVTGKTDELEKRVDELARKIDDLMVVCGQMGDVEGVRREYYFIGQVLCGGETNQ